jgi:hypothetical protein
MIGYHTAYLEYHILIGRWPIKVHGKLARGFILLRKFGELFPDAFHLWLHITCCFHKWTLPSIRSGPMGLAVLDDLRLDLILEGVEKGLGRQAAGDNQAKIVRNVVALMIRPDSVDI